MATLAQLQARQARIESQIEAIEAQLRGMASEVENLMQPTYADLAALSLVLRRGGLVSQTIDQLRTLDEACNAAAGQVSRLAAHSAPPIDERRAAMAELERIEQELNGMEQTFQIHADWR